MFITRVEPEKINNKRLDADFYHPDYLAVEQKLASVDTQQLGACGKFFAGPFGSKLPSNLYLDEGVPLFRVGNVGQFEVLVDNFAHLAPAVHQELISSEVMPGDILIVKASVGEKIARVPEWLPRANITQHIIGIRPNDVFDSDYVCAFLYSKFGRSQLERFALGSVIQYLGVNDARLVQAYKPSLDVQKYIGDKVRQADQLKAWARQVETEVSDFHRQFIPSQSNLDFSKKTRLVTPLRMTERLDAHFYPAVVDDYITSHNAIFAPLGKVSRTVFNGQTQEETADPVAIDQITVTNLSPTYVKGEARRVYKPVTDEKFTRKHDLLVCNAAHNKSYIGRNVTYCHSENPFLPSTEVMVIRVNRDELPASFVRTYLLSRLGFVQIQSTIRGITAHSYPTDMKKLDIPVPEVPAELRHAWFTCDERMASAGYACEIANKLTAAAKLMVEALIEGRLTEQHLIDAQKALEVDEMGFDRAILARLTNKGVDNDGDPLFPDLDQLYDLLAKSQSPDE